MESGEEDEKNQLAGGGVGHPRPGLVGNVRIYAHPLMFRGWSATRGQAPCLFIMKSVRPPLF